MKIYKKFLILFAFLAIFTGFVAKVYAVNPTLSLSSSGNNVMINVSGDPNSSVVLYYNLSYGTQSTVLGTTNSSGFLSTYVSANSYNITSGSLVYVLVNNQQSASMAWPSAYSSTFTLSNTNLSLNVGQTSYVTANNNFGTLYVSSNSNPNVATASISGNTISVYGSTSGTTSFNICQSGNTNSCVNLYVTVGGGVNYGTNTGINISNISLSVGNSVTFNSSNGSSLYVSSNSNPSVATTGSASINPGCYSGAVYSTITGQPCYYQNIQTSSSSMTVTALSYGSTTITICQSNNTSACTTFTINVNSNVNVGSVLGTSTGFGCYIGRTLRFGMYGADVACLQSLLSAKGYLVSGINSSAYFDQSTYNAVILFQRANYLSADGVVGNMTRNRLMY